MPRIRVIISDADDDESLEQFTVSSDKLTSSASLGQHVKDLIGKKFEVEDEDE